MALYGPLKSPKGPTHYSMNSLFSELFRKFEGVILGVHETIWGCLGKILKGKLNLKVKMMSSYIIMMVCVTTVYTRAISSLYLYLEAIVRCMES